MPSYPLRIRRCQHIKVNGVKCGSPAVREHEYCYFHVRWHRKGMRVNPCFREQQRSPLPTLEDANSIQVVLAEVIKELKAGIIDHRTAALLLYAFQIASGNVKFTGSEPEQPTQVSRRASLHSYGDESDDGAPGVPARPKESLSPLSENARISADT